MVRNRGVIFALVFAIAVIIFALMNGGIKHDEPENAVYCSTDSDDLRADERQKVKEEDDEEAVVAITNIGIVYEPDPYEETEEILYSEVLTDEERVTRETDSDYADDSTDPDSVGNSVWTPEADNVAGEPVDVWDMGLEWYGISYEDTNRTLRLITYEGYGDSMLSYYVACCCWVRATEGYWGYDNLYSAFGEADTNYGTWMDDTVIADYAYYYLEECYRNPSYIKYVNGMASPSNYIYYSEEYGIYVWN